MDILSPFLALPYRLLLVNLKIAEGVSSASSIEQQAHAVVDADALAFLDFLPEALGPKLGHAFIKAYREGKIAKAATLIKRSEVGTELAKNSFRYPRPYIAANTQSPVDTVILANNKPYETYGFSFPSGHTSAGYTDALLLASMLPERFLPLVDRAAGYGYSRVVLNVHYPLDVIGSRMIAERNVAQFLADPAYRKLFDEAKSELRQALEAACDEPIAACATAGPASDPWADKGMRRFYAFTMTYGLPQIGATDVAMQAPEHAEVLLEAVAPGLRAEKRRDVLMHTALASGYPLDASNDARLGYWQRIDLDAAVRAVAAPATTP
ncbi:phosphatase PAP2 family protein [Beijerinckia sp. L45]|uniref:acid phosphatase n=1 Tax=Beijerinckia sp. L45 TaxID=1641855 RepID=UPI00131D7F1D|nr:phosphatase PAP2 family protein [Beijerinckia sp. L45]